MTKGIRYPNNRRRNGGGGGLESNCVLDKLYERWKSLGIAFDMVTHYEMLFGLKEKVTQYV